MPHSKIRAQTTTGSSRASGPRWLPLGRRAVAGVILLVGIIAGVWSVKVDPAPGRAIRPLVSTDQMALREQASVPVNRGRSWREMDDPALDGWDIEAFHEQVKEQLQVLGKLVTHSEHLDEKIVATLATREFTCRSLRPEKLTTVFEDEAVRVERGYQGSDTSDDADDTTAWRSSEDERGPRCLAAAVTQLAEPLRQAPDARCEFKVVSVERSGEMVTTRQVVSCSGTTPAGLMEQHATWLAKWRAPLDSTDGPPRLVNLQAVDYEQVATRRLQGPLYVDCTASVLGSNACYAEQFLRGLNHWLERMQDMRYFPLLGAAGLAVGDVNGDRLDDLYVCQEAGLPNRLFLQSADATAREGAAACGVDWLEATRSALLVDLDNDGDQDLVAGVIGAIVMAANDGHGRFETRRVLATWDDVMSLTAADYDQDGDLDLYACVNYANDWVTDSSAQSMAATAEGFVYHDANNGGRNSLFRNDGSWNFVDVTAAVGLEVNNRRYSLAAAWEDFDNDGDQDLYVANDYGRNNLYRNDVLPGGGVWFVDVAAPAQAEDSASGMSVSWADVDHDGWSDIYVGNMFSSAGNRIMFQPHFKPQSSKDVRARLQRFARGNTLLRNGGDGVFDDVSEAAAVTLGRWAWGSNFVDVNNDGWDDLVVANGYITTEDTGDL